MSKTKLFNIKIEYEEGDLPNVSPNDSEVRCPVCDFNFNDVGKIERIPGNDNYEAQSLGWNRRGDLIVLDMQCENNHKWQMCIGFHKGVLSMFARTGGKGSA